MSFVIKRTDVFHVPHVHAEHSGDAAERATQNLVPALLKGSLWPQTSVKEQKYPSAPVGQ